MIEAGKSFCPYCVRVHTGSYYSNPDLDWGVWLKRSALGNNYKVDPTNFGVGDLPKSVTLIPSTEYDRSIQVEVLEDEDAKRPKRMRLFRACPVCAEEKDTYRPMLREVGKYKTFVVVMIGDTAAGKSAWLDSIATLNNTDHVNQGNYIHRLSYITPATEEKRPESTPASSRGQTKLLEIKNRADHDRTVALVYLVDVGGELYKLKRTGDAETDRVKEMEVIWNLLDSNGDYPGADGFVFVAPAIPKKMENSVSADKIYVDLVQKGLITNRPLAFVMTHADQLIEKNVFREVQVDNSHTIQVPVMSKDTFSRPTSYKKEALRGRVAIEHAIARAYDSPVLNTEDAPTKGFVVQSCGLHLDEEIQEDGTTQNVLMEDFSQNLNVMDPLIWVLNQLKIFPLEEVK